MTFCRKTKNQSEFYIVTGDWDNSVDEGTEQQFNLSRIHFYPKYEGWCQLFSIFTIPKSNKSFLFHKYLTVTHLKQMHGWKESPTS